MDISDSEFEEMISWAVEQTAPVYRERLQNVAFLVEDEPTEDQKRQMNLRGDQLLLGLYEGVPLPARNGTIKLLPDKITLFKDALLSISASRDQLRENIRHTVWHEVAHYFGLDHKRIRELDGTS
ncbi:MAG TPA: metallopeptidase family protein [Candidatus Saccharimonadales bacterium]|nr:metallopeptidase family protein [Candidatus Saccharimonadales bacterium]